MTVPAPGRRLVRLLLAVFFGALVALLPLAGANASVHAPVASTVTATSVSDLGHHLAGARGPPGPGRPDRPDGRHR